MDYSDYRQFDAQGLAELIAKGEVSAAEVMAAAIARAEEVNPAINAIVHENYDAARAAVAEGAPSGPFGGVPFLIKDLAFFEKGQPATRGSKLFADYLADHDSAFVRKTKTAGLVSMGRSNTPEFGLTATTESKLLGPCRNPWNLNHSTGGSSGGAAAAVAAGILPMAHATDGGGSIRIPAANCGLVGLKPSRGRISFAPDAGEGWGGMSIGLVVSRSVRDTALLLDCTSTPEPGDPYFAPTPDRPFAEEVGAPVVGTQGRPLRIAFTTTDWAGEPLGPECVAAVEATAKLCADLGHEVTEARPQFDVQAMRSANAKVVAANIWEMMRQRWAVLGKEPNAGDVERVSWFFGERGRTLSAGKYIEAIQTLHRVSREFAAFFADHDVILSTCLRNPPVELGYLDMDSEDISTYFSRIGGELGITPIFNVTGGPAISLPLHWSAAGLPVGLHFGADMGREDILIRLAAQLEEARPWFNKLANL